MMRVGFTDRAICIRVANGLCLEGNSGCQTKQFSQMRASVCCSHGLAHRAAPSLVQALADQFGDVSGTTLAVRKRHELQIGFYIQNLQVPVYRDARVDAVNRFTRFHPPALPVDKSKTFLVDQMKFEFNGAIITLETFDAQCTEMVLSTALCR